MHLSNPDPLPSSGPKSSLASITIKAGSGLSFTSIRLMITLLSRVISQIAPKPHLLWSVGYSTLLYLTPIVEA